MTLKPLITSSRTTSGAISGPTGNITLLAAKKWSFLPIAAVIAFVVPVISGGSSLFTWTTVAIWALFALSTNVLFGWTGLLSFGQTAFFGVGAYVVGIVEQWHPGLIQPLPLLGALVAGALLAAFFAIGALRTSGPEFAILTLVLAQVLYLLTYRVPALHGDDGFAGLANVNIGATVLQTDKDYWYFAVVLVAACVWLLRRLYHSSLGAVMRAVRDDPWRAAALGMPVRKVQVIAFSVGGGFSSVAGGLMAQHQGVASPSLLTFTISGEVLVACLIGGRHTFWGPVIGAVIFIWAQQLLSGTSLDPGLFVGVLLLVIVLILPGGVSSLPALVRRWMGRARTPGTGRTHGQGDQPARAHPESPSGSGAPVDDEAAPDALTTVEDRA